MSDELYFNGIDASSGSYSMAPMTPELLSDLIQGQSLDPARMQELQNWHQKQTAGSPAMKQRAAIYHPMASWLKSQLW